LDLRTPRTWSTSAPEPPPPAYEPRPRGAYTPGPIWVDEVVLACVNHAYDVALAHRAAEVRLEHLLHALTRIDAAAEVLEARGVRVAALRRETATVIASELPVGVANGKAGPRHSEELEHVLRASSLIAARRNAPASVDDLMHLMLDVEPDLPGLSLLARINPRLAAEPVYARPPQPQPPPQPTYAPPYFAEPPREPAPPRPPVYAARPEYSNAAIDYQQNARLEALEQMIRAISVDLGSERESVGGLIGELKHEISSLRLKPQAMADLSPIVDRVGSIERSVTAGFEQFALALASIENDLRSRAAKEPDLTALTGRLDIIEEAVLSRDTERAVRELSDRLERLDTSLAGERTRNAEAGAALRGEIGLLAGALEAQRSEVSTAVLPVADRMTELRSAIESRQVQAEESMRLLGDRIAGLEQLVADTLQKVIETQTSGREELGEISEALVKLNANQHTLAGNIDLWRGEARAALDQAREEIKIGAAGVISGVDAMSPRVSLIEAEANRIGALVDGLSGTVENMHRVTVERYYRRNRFWYWLFGTDDWVASSWPSQSHRIAEELKAVKTVARR
jgi:hypothetical protein